MKFRHGIGTAESIDSLIKFHLIRLEPGSSDDDFEAQFIIHYFGRTEHFGLPGKWVTGQVRYVMIQLIHKYELDRLLNMKKDLAPEIDDLRFAMSMAEGIVGMFEVNPGLMYDTTYALTIPSQVAREHGWNDLPTAPYPLEDHRILSSTFVREITVDDEDSD